MLRPGKFHRSLIKNLFFISFFGIPLVTNPVKANGLDFKILRTLSAPLAGPACSYTSNKIQKTEDHCSPQGCASEFLAEQVDYKNPEKPERYAILNIDKKNVRLNLVLSSEKTKIYKNKNTSLTIRITNRNGDASNYRAAIEINHKGKLLTLETDGSCDL